MHSGKKPNKCEQQCNYATSQVSNLRRRMKTHNEKSPTNVTSTSSKQFEETYENPQWRKAPIGAPTETRYGGGDIAGTG